MRRSQQPKSNNVWDENDRLSNQEEIPKTSSTKRAKSYFKKNGRNKQDSNSDITSTNPIEITNGSNNASNIDSAKKKKTAGTAKEENASFKPRPDGNLDEKSSAVSVPGSLMNKLTTTSEIIRNKKPYKSSTADDDEHKSSSIISFNTRIIQLPKTKLFSSNDIRTGNGSETNNDQTTNLNNMASMNGKSLHSKSKRKLNRVSSINVAIENGEEILTTNIKPGIIVTLNADRFHQAHPINDSNPKGDHDKRKQATILGGIIVSKVKTSNVDADKITKNTRTTKEENTSSESYGHQDSYEKSSIMDHQPVSQDSSVNDSSLKKLSKASEIPEKNKSSKNKASPTYDTRTSNALELNSNQTKNRDHMVNTVKEDEENNLATHTKPGIIVTLNPNRYHHVRPMSTSNSKVDEDKRKQAPSFGGITVTKVNTNNVSDQINDVDSTMDNRSASQHSSRSHSSRNRSSRASEIIARNTPVEPSTAREEEHESSSVLPRNRETPSYGRQPSNVSESNNNLATHTEPGIIVTLNPNRYHHARPVTRSNSKVDEDKRKQASSFGGITVTKVNTNNISDQINDVDSAMDNRSVSQHSSPSHPSRSRLSRASEIIATNIPVESSTAREEHESPSSIPRNRETPSYNRQPSNVSESNINLATHTKPGIIVTLNPNRYHHARPVTRSNSKVDEDKRKQASSFGGITVTKVNTNNISDQINDVDSAMDNRSASQHSSRSHSSRNRSSRASEIVARNTIVQSSTAHEEEHESSPSIPRNRENSSYSRQPSNLSETNNNQTTNRDSPINVVNENEESNLATHTKSGIIVTLNPNRYHQAHPVSHSNSKNDNATRKRASSFGTVTVSKIKSTHDKEQSNTNVAVPNDDQNETNTLVTEVSV